MSVRKEHRSRIIKDDPARLYTAISLDHAGVDEAGRGPLAGPVYAAAVILDPERPIAGLADSKLLSHQKRESLDALIREHASAWAIGIASVEEIDTLNILQASMLAMQRAVANLSSTPKLALIDGNRCPELSCKSIAIIKGDQKIPAISAASIVAKVARDRMMWDFNILYPGYGFAKHKGYPTFAHLQALIKLGASPIHRRSFAPVRSLLQKS